MMDVHNGLGPGWKELAYRRAFLSALRGRGLEARDEVRGELKHRGGVVDRFQMDIVVEDLVILELKHIEDNFAPRHYFQIMNYLKIWGKQLGFLVNFGLERLRHKRLVFFPGKGVVECSGPWTELDPSATADAVCKSIWEAHGPGYGQETWNRIFEAECHHQDIPIRRPVVDLAYEGQPLGEHPVPAWLLDEKILVLLTALREGTRAADLSRFMSYLKHTGLRKAILANFGKETLTLRAVVRH